MFICFFFEVIFKPKLKWDPTVVERISILVQWRLLVLVGNIMPPLRPKSNKHKWIELDCCLYFLNFILMKRHLEGGWIGVSANLETKCGS